MARAEKELVDYQSQADRPFEHEERLKQLLDRQAELNSLLDLDKGDQQATNSPPEINEELESSTPVVTPGRMDVAKMAEKFMRASGTAIQEMPILQRTPPQSGPVTGKSVAKDESHIAVATSANRFIVVEAQALGRDVQIGDRVSLLFAKGRPSIDNDRDRAR